MRIVCAWCEHEGRPAEMSVREPLEDPTATHGLCPEHFTALVQEPPAPRLHLRKLQGYIWQLEQQLQFLQSGHEGLWVQALRTQLDSVLRDVASMLAEPPEPSREGNIASLRAWILPMRIHTQLIHHTLQRGRQCIQRAQHRIARGRVLLRARSHVRESAATKPPEAD
jgi:hypothetical protein